MQSGYAPAAARARAHACAVAPVVSTSSTMTTCAFAITAGNGPAVIRPRRLRSRARADSPAESRTLHQTRRHGSTRQPSSDPAATRAHRTTGSPPRRRAEIRRLGEGTSISGRPGVRNSASPAASASPSGPARSRLPRSFTASTACRAGPRYGLSAQHGTPGSLRGWIRTGGPPRLRAQSRHHSVPGRRQPPHSGGRTRSRSARIRASVPLGTDTYRPEDCAHGAAGHHPAGTAQRRPAPDITSPMPDIQCGASDRVGTDRRVQPCGTEPDHGTEPSAAGRSTHLSRPARSPHRRRPVPSSPGCPDRRRVDRRPRDRTPPRHIPRRRPVRCRRPSRSVRGQGRAPEHPPQPDRHHDADRRRTVPGPQRQPGSTGTASAPRPGTSRQ